MQDRIEKRIELNAPIARVWRALTDYREFGTWFRVDLEGPFIVGETLRGRVTYPGYEHMKWEAHVEAMEPERYFSFSWYPGTDDSDRDLSNEPTTLVEFTLEASARGTILTISESGFAALPSDLGKDALRLNTQGWDEQAKNIAAHVSN